MSNYIPWSVLCTQVDYRINEDRKTNMNASAILICENIPGWGDRWRRCKEDPTAGYLPVDGTEHLFPSMGWGCMGRACGHGYLSACWDLQRFLWLNYARARDWAVPAGFGSCRWNLCVHFGKNYFFECCQQEALKKRQGNITEERSLGKKFQNYLKFSNN